MLTKNSSFTPFGPIDGQERKLLSKKLRYKLTRVVAITLTLDELVDLLLMGALAVHLVILAFDQVLPICDFYTLPIKRSKVNRSHV